jgi:hypothetical protein
LLPTQHDRVARGWRRFGGAILFVLLAAGCSSAGSTGTPVASGTPAATVAPLATRSVAADAQFAAALAPLRASSAFETSVEVDGATVVSATGRAVGHASRSTVTTAGRTVEYIEVPPKAWARSSAGSWVLVAVTQASIAPLDALARPLGLEVVAPPTGAAFAFRATYPASALGLEGDALTVSVTVAGDAVTFRYEMTTAGHRTASTTTIRPAPADPIKGPAA